MKGNILVLRDLKKNSPWCDKDHAMLYACFQLLVDFLEKEKPDSFGDFKHDKVQRARRQEMRVLYRYWKLDRPKLELKINALLLKWSDSRKTKLVPGSLPKTTREIVLREDKRTRKLLQKAEDQFQGLEEEMLGRLIAIRRHLWC